MFKTALLSCIVLSCLCRSVEGVTELPTMAIGNFEVQIENQYKQEFENFPGVFQAQLVNSRKFNLVERSRLEQAFKEQGLSESGLVSSRMQRIGELVGAQFISYGSVSGVEQVAYQKFDQFKVTVDLNVLDATSGSIKWAGDVITVASGSLSDAMRKSAADVARKVMFSIYPVTVASIKGSNTLVLNYGNDYLETESDLIVYSLGNEIKDPATGLSLGKEENYVGLARLTKALDKHSEAYFYPSAEYNPSSDAVLICRVLSPYDPVPAELAKDKKSKPTAGVSLIYAAGVSKELKNKTNALESMIVSRLSAGAAFDVVDRGEFSSLVEERLFSDINSPVSRRQRFGRDESADYIITIDIQELGATSIKRGNLRTQFVGSAYARIVNTEDGTPLATANAEIKDFFMSDEQAMGKLADELVEKINDAAKRELVGEDAVVQGAEEAIAAELTVLRVRPDGKVMVSDDHNTLTVGDELTVFSVDEFPDPRNPSTMLRDEILVGRLKVERKSSAGVIATTLTPDASFEALMVARRASPAGQATGHGGSPSAVSARGSTAAAVPQADSRTMIPKTGVKPTLHIGKFRYSNEFDLSQTADRTSGSNAGGGTLATLGAVAGGLLKGGKPEEWLPAALLGGVVGQVGDNERQRSNERDANKSNPVVGDASALKKESPVLREMVLTKAHASQRFSIIEDSRLDEIKELMDREEDGDFEESSLVRRGGLKTAKYSAFGTILRYETNSKKKGFSIAGGSEKVEMTLTMALRVVDNETGETVVSDQLSGSIETGSSQVGFLGFGTASENQGAIGELMDVLARNVIAKIVTSLWPIQIISVNWDERVVMINAGETIVKNRDRLTIFQPGEKIYDPYSGMELGSEEQTIGEIEIFETQAMFSRGRIIRPVGDTRNMVVAGQVCRPVVTRSAVADQPVRKGGF